MTRILLLSSVQGVIFALAALPVRIQLSLFDGFDFAVAVAILVSSEVFSVVARALSCSAGAKVAIASGLSLAASVGLMVAWNRIVDVMSQSPHSGRKVNLFVLSLGLSVVAAGLVGLLRGPGLRQSDLNNLSRVSLVGGVSLEHSVAYALLMSGAVLVLTFGWLRLRSGFSLLLLAEDPALAREVGVDRSRIVLPAAVVGGLSAGVVGSYYALASGSTIEIGLSLFLYGAGSALVFSDFRAFVWGGLLLGSLLVWLQLVVSPSWANALVFACVVSLVGIRGSSRLRQGVR